MIRMSLQEQVSLLIFGAVLLAVYGTELFLWARYFMHRLGHRPRGNLLLTKPAVVVHVLAGIGVLCMLYAHFIEPYWVEVNRVPIHTAKLQEATFRIVQISDLHVDTIPRNEAEMVRIVNGLEPDVIVATGDFLNEKEAVPRLKDALSRLEARLGKFAVKGNHWPGTGLLEGTGFRLLERETVVLEKGADTLGLYGMGFVHADRLREPVEPLPQDRFDVLLFHTPDLAEDVAGMGIDLYLCGHTHGGQIAMPLYGALITFSRHGKKYEAGRYEIGDTTLYVNRGLGMEPRPAPQMRFFARPEIAVFDVQPQR